MEDPIEASPQETSSQNTKDLSSNSILSGYTELVGEKQFVEGSNRWSTERLLATYVSHTDGLIGKMDGSIPLNNAVVYVPDEETGVKSEHRDLSTPDSAIYLDKSARPIEWMVRALWPMLATDKATRPTSYFLNIDKGDWLRRMGVPPHLLEDTPESLIDITKIDREHLSRVRSLYTPPGVRIEENSLEEAWKHPTIFDNSHVMIVDELKSSGNTLSIAMQLLSRAIPDATFSGAHWVVPKMVSLNRGIEVEGKMQFMREWVPVWYDSQTASGRGVGDRDPRWPEKAGQKGYSVTSRKQLGKYISSTPPHDLQTFDLMKDAKSLRIRADIKKMARDLREGKILYIPSSDRPSESEEDFQKLKERIIKINKTDFTEWKKRRDKLFESSQQ